MSYPEIVAQKLIESIGILSIDDLMLLNEIAFIRGALVVREKLSGSEAQLLISRPHSLITISTSVTNENRYRFDIAHEIGHLEMHKHKCIIFDCTRDDLDSGSSNNKVSSTLENEANEFASFLLMPSQFINPFCKDKEISTASIRELADRFQVSLTAAALRFICISKEPLAIVLSTNGFIRWFEGNIDFKDLGLFIDVKSKLSNQTIAYRAFQGLTLPTKAMQVPLHAWMRPGPFSQKATLSEQSISMSSFNSVLSLIWINEIIDDDF